MKLCSLISCRGDWLERVRPSSCDKERCAGTITGLQGAVQRDRDYSTRGDMALKFLPDPLAVRSCPAQLGNASKIFGPGNNREHARECASGSES